MNRKYSIARVLILVFVFSGLLDLTLDCIAADISSHGKSTTDERPEFQRFLKSNSLPVEGNFSRSKTETECEEEIDHNRADLTLHPTNAPDIVAAVATIARTEITQNSYPEPDPVFLRNRQFRI